MFATKRENREALDRAWAVLEGKGRGDVMEHDILESLLGRRRPDSRYYDLVKALRQRLLRDRGILLSSIPLVGYELSDTNRQLLEPERREKFAGRHRRKGLKAVELLPVADCDFTQQRQKAGIEDRMALAVRQSREEQTRLGYLMRPKETRPRPYRGDAEATG